MAIKSCKRFSSLPVKTLLRTKQFLAIKYRNVHPIGTISTCAVGGGVGDVFVMVGLKLFMETLLKANCSIS